MCKHETEYLMGVAGGVICTKCGQHFDHIPKQEPVKVAEVKTEEPIEEKPKRTRAKKGAK